MGPFNCGCCRQLVDIGRWWLTQVLLYNICICYFSGYKEFLRDFMLSQMESYEAAGNALGWFFWTAKTERHSAPEWDYLFLLDHDIAPINLCNRTRNVC